MATSVYGAGGLEKGIWKATETREYARDLWPRLVGTNRSAAYRIAIHEEISSDSGNDPPNDELPELERSMIFARCDKRHVDRHEERHAEESKNDKVNKSNGDSRRSHSRQERAQVKDGESDTGTERLRNLRQILPSNLWVIQKLSGEFLPHHA